MISYSSLRPKAPYLATHGKTIFASFNPLSFLRPFDCKLDLVDNKHLDRVVKFGQRAPRAQIWLYIYATFQDLALGPFHPHNMIMSPSSACYKKGN